MSQQQNIKKLQDLVSSSLEKDEVLVGTDISRLTAPGENYGSIMLRILITVKNKYTGKERVLDTVGKIIPESERTREIFQTQTTFRNEFMYYSVIVPTLDQFIRSKGISSGANFAAKFYGGRLNLDSSSQRVDEDAILLMENLKTAGYTTGNKSEGLDVDTFKIILDSLAQMHAAALALKIEDRKRFETNLRPYFLNHIPETQMVQTIKKNIMNVLKNAGFSEEQIRKAAYAMDKDSHKTDINENYGTLIHYDSWVNNFLLKFNGNKAVHAVIVDFQVFDYGTPLNDVTFLIFTSLRTDLVEENMDVVLKYYYERFVNNLKQLGVDTAKYTEESFQNEVKIAAKDYEYCHAMWMLLPIMHEEFQSVDDIDKNIGNETMNWDENHKAKIVQVTKSCLKRGWL